MIEIAAFMIALCVSIALHEAAHAYTADWLGDATPRSQGRVTLNPFRHLSLVGTLLPFLGILTQSPFWFGWGKPVMVQPAAMRYGRWGNVLCALAGPASNLVMCVIIGVLLRTSSDPTAERFLLMMLQLNAVLAVFNLLPIPPLDGSTLLQALLPRALRDIYEDYILPYGLFILIALVLSGQLKWLSWLSSHIVDLAR
jgi:Zn-dependent protease